MKKSRLVNTFVGSRKRTGPLSRKAALVGAALGGLAVFGPVLTAAPAQAQTLETALAAAYENNPTLAARRARLRSTDEEVPQALANWRPSVELTGDVGREYDKSTVRFSGGRVQQRTPGSLGVSVSQPLYRGGRTVAATDQARNTVKAERARLVSTEQDVLLQAATAYLNVFRDEAVLRLNINNEKVLKRQLEATRDRFEVGEITRTDVHQAEARLAQARADRIQAEGDLENSRANYENVVGVAVPKGLELPPNPEGLPANRRDAVKQAATRNPAVVAADFDRRAADSNVREIKGELLPEVDISASADRSYQSASEQGYADNAVVALNLTIPIYQQGAVYSRVRAARQDLAEAIQLIDQARRDAVESATSAWEALQTAQARVKSLQSQIEANVVALDGVEREAAVGSRTVLNVLDAEQELLDSRVSHARAQRDEAVAAYELMSAIGRLTAQDMKLPVDIYDPTAHFREVEGKLFGGSSSGEGK